MPWRSLGARKTSRYSSGREPPHIFPCRVPQLLREENCLGRDEIGQPQEVCLVLGLSQRGIEENRSLAHHDLAFRTLRHGIELVRDQDDRLPRLVQLPAEFQDCSRPR